MPPDLSSMFVTFGMAIIGNAVVIGVLAHIAKGWFDAGIARDTEKLKAELKAEGDNALETLRATLKAEGDTALEQVKADLKIQSDTALELIRQDAGREIESYKVKLKKSEFLFQAQFEAAGAMMKLFHDFNPTKQHPEMDWSEVCDDIISNASVTETALRNFMVAHGAALDETDRKTLEKATSRANDLCMGEYGNDGESECLELRKLLRELRAELIAKVHGQSSL